MKKKWSYYNDNDPRVCAWVRELIKNKMIPEGEVDERSITEVKPDDIREFLQVHMFCGIGGWAEALRIAGVGPDEPLWTGSCPCQPFSCAGQGKGEKDSRHLWPEFYRLIKECKPDLVFGEQVEAAIGKGWLDGVFTDLEAENYTCGAAVLGAHSVGAPHIRQRLYWVADSGCLPKRGSNAPRETESGGPCRSITGCSAVGRLADTEHTERGPELQRYEFNRDDAGRNEASSWLGTRCEDGGTADANGEHGDGIGFSSSNVSREQLESSEVQRGGSGFWSNSIWLPCTDGKARRVSSEPESFPLAHGIPGRVGLLRGYGNAIIPQVAAEFIKAFLTVRQ